MILTPISSRESARKIFFINSAYIMSEKVEIKRFWTQETEMNLTPISSLESARKKIFMNSVHDV